MKTTIAKRVLEFMQMHDINQTELARASGLSQSLMSKILSGKRGRRLSHSTICEIARVLGTTPEALTVEQSDRIIRKKTNAPIKEIFDLISDATNHVENILPFSNIEQVHICCHILTAIARLEYALLQDNWTQVYAEEYALQKLLEDSFCNLYASEEVIEI